MRKIRPQSSRDLIGNNGSQPISGKKVQSKSFRGLIIQVARHLNQTYAMTENQMRGYLNALGEDLMRTGGHGGDDLYGKMFCNGCGGTNTPGICTGSSCTSCNGKGINVSGGSGNWNWDVDYEFNGNWSCNITYSF